MDWTGLDWNTLTGQDRIYDYIISTGQSLRYESTVYWYFTAVSTVFPYYTLY